MTQNERGPFNAIVREVPTSFANALTMGPAKKISVDLAREQHGAYRLALAACGAEVTVVPADDACPDCCFVEDTAVIVGERALITRPGAPSRRPETPAIARALADLELFAMAEPATLDGGDCMRVGTTIYVGRSARTNAAGIARLAEVFGNVVAIDLPPHVLHLKCVVSPLDDERILLADQSLDAKLFDAAVVRIPIDETYAANAVAIGRHVIVADGFPRTHEALANAGFTLHPVPTSEVRKADGSLTCQSLIVVSGL